MKRCLILAAAAASTLTAVPGFAQDATASSGDMMFGGAFVGGQAGWGRRTVDNAAIDKSRSGVDYGAYAGFDAPLGQNFLVGAEGDIGAGGRTLRQTFGGVGTTSINPSWNWSVSGRAGFLASPNLLFYGRVGYGEERVRTRFNSATVAASTSNRSWTDGVIYGGGIEYALTPQLHVRGEYRYSNFDGSYNPQQALVGVSFRF